MLVVVLSHRLAITQNVSEKYIGDLLFYGAILGLVGGRALYFATHLHELKTWSSVLNPRHGGVSMYGALICILPFYFWYCHTQRCDAKQIADIFAPCLAFGLSVHRLGCFGAGCCFGSETNVPWAIWLHALWRHPSQLYEAIPLGLAGCFLLVLHNKKSSHGQVVWAFACVYAPLRFVGEWFRDSPNRGVVFEDLLSLPQAMTIIAWLIAWIWLRSPYSVEKKNG